MAPEQAAGNNAAIDARTDLFALGAIVYEMLAGRPAFSGDSVVAVIMNVVTGTPVPLASLAPAATPEVTAAIEQLTRRIGYHPVTLKKEVPGFVENRVLYAIMRECLALVDEGVIDVEGLDLCVKWGIGYKLAVVPPIQLLDMAGLDIYTAVASFLNADLSNESGISKTATDLRDSGRLGIKAGQGFFEYTPERVAELQAQRGAALVAVRKALS